MIISEKILWIIFFLLVPYYCTCKWFFSRTDSITNINEENGFYYLQQQAIRLIVCNILLYTDICILYIICTHDIYKKGKIIFENYICFIIIHYNINYLSIQVDNWWRSVLLYPNSEFGKYEVNIFCPMNLGQNHLQWSTNWFHQN